MIRSASIFKRSEDRQWAGLLYVLPFIIGMLVFKLYPFMASFYYSFTDFSLLRKETFVGLSNYVYMFTKDPLFFPSLKATFLYVLLSVPGKLGFALIIAVILNMKLKFISLYRTIYYLPSILGGSVAIAVLWRSMFTVDGIVNQFLTSIGIPAVNWFGIPSLAIMSISLLTVWQFGSSMVLFLAGLKQIPKDLYEAGTIDGASKLRMFFSITFPLLTPILFFNLIMQTVNAFQEFTAAFLITNGGPLNSTYLFGLKLYQDAFQFSKMGYASALSWILFICIMLFTIIAFKSQKYWTHYEDGGKF
ncbi:carbohydrate ABC transporter permease [Paenibacillus sp. SYP-B4298]|uniref:carbohydrate ABC transporter permease n=1 Tax=Paenibacillus sp. SYP-B4298 TaxID=2996034 RepID=UPI0022DD04EE|nr:sugar ABC transporter permease [Paenibacillus sp. SYP-B4298]